MRVKIYFLMISFAGCSAYLPKEAPRLIDEAVYEKNQYQKPVGTGPKLINIGKPFFPMSALNRKQEGWCIADYDITPEGLTTNIKILDCSPKVLFEKACRIQVERLRFASTDKLTTGMIQRCIYKLKH